MREDLRVTSRGRTSDELKNDEQWVYPNRPAIVRAKAMAFILSNCEDYANVDEVHIVIGPKIDRHQDPNGQQRPW